MSAMHTENEYRALAPRYGIRVEDLDAARVGEVHARDMRALLDALADESGMPACMRTEALAERALPTTQPQQPVPGSPPAPVPLHAVPEPGFEPAQAATDEAVAAVVEEGPDEPESRFYGWQVALPRDTASRFAESHADGGGHLAGRTTVRHLHLLAAGYRMTRQQAHYADGSWRLLVTGSLLAAAAGWKQQSLRKMLTNDDHPLSPWWTVESHRRGMYEIRVQPAPFDNSAHLPFWWFWEEPAPGADGADRFIRRISASHTGILAALALANVVDYDTLATRRYGATGLATMVGVHPVTMKKALREAEEAGMVAITQRGLDAAGRVEYALRMSPSDPVSVPRTAPSQRS